MSEPLTRVAPGPSEQRPSEQCPSEYLEYGVRVGPRFARDVLDHVHHGFTIVGTRGDIEEGQFIGAFLVITTGIFNRVAGVTYIDKLDTLDHATIVDIETGDDAFC